MMPPSSLEKSTEGLPTQVCLCVEPVFFVASCRGGGSEASSLPPSLSTLVTSSAPQEVIFWSSSEAPPSEEMKPGQVY